MQAGRTQEWIANRCESNQSQQPERKDKLITGTKEHKERERESQGRSGSTACMTFLLFSLCLSPCGYHSVSDGVFQLR